MSIPFDGALGIMAHQPALSLKTRDYLTAVRFASDLAGWLLPLVNPTIDEVKSI